MRSDMNNKSDYGHQYVVELRVKHSTHYNIIKFVSFEHIYYAINMSVVSSIFSNMLLT